MLQALRSRLVLARYPVRLEELVHAAGRRWECLRSDACTCWDDCGAGELNLLKKKCGSQMVWLTTFVFFPAALRGKCLLRALRAIICATSAVRNAPDMPATSRLVRCSGHLFQCAIKAPKRAQGAPRASGQRPRLGAAQARRFLFLSVVLAAEGGGAADRPLLARFSSERTVRVLESDAVAQEFVLRMFCPCPSLFLFPAIG